ncbi:MAG: iron-sulfur cluster insertion protein ErpA [Alphaproteobacteria bacterium]
MTALAERETARQKALESPQKLLISPRAAQQLSVLFSAENDPDLMLRISVSGGGCSGFQYGFSFDSETTGDDLIFEQNGVRVVVDEISLELLAGAEVDYVDELIGASFQIRNPNATSSCGCGNSFAI